MKTTEHGIEDSKDVAHEKGHDSLGKELRRRMAAVEGRVEAPKSSEAQGTGPVMPAPVPPRRRAVRRTLEGSLRQSPGWGGSTPTW